MPALRQLHPATFETTLLVPGTTLIFPMGGKEKVDPPVTFVLLLSEETAHVQVLQSTERVVACMAAVPPGSITGAPVAAVWGCGDMGAG